MAILLQETNFGPNVKYPFIHAAGILKFGRLFVRIALLIYSPAKIKKREILFESAEKFADQVH